MVEQNTKEDIKNFKIIYLQQTSTGFDLMERADLQDKFSFSSKGSLKINFKTNAAYIKAENFNTYLPFYFFEVPSLIFSILYDKEKAMEVLLNETKNNVAIEIETIEQEIKSLEYKKNFLLKISYKKSE